MCLTPRMIDATGSLINILRQGASSSPIHTVITDGAGWGVGWGMGIVIPVMDGRSQRSRCQQTLCLVRAPSRFMEQVYSHCALTWRRGEGALWGVSFLGIHSWNPCPNDLITSLKGPFLKAPSH